MSDPNLQMQDLKATEQQPPLAGSQAGEDARIHQDPSGSSTNIPNVERKEAGCCGCKTTQGVMNGGFERIDRNSLSFNPETGFDGVTKCYLDVHSGGDFYYFAAKRCNRQRPFSFKVMVPSKENNLALTHLYSINHHMKCCCDDCNCVAFQYCCCFYLCCDSVFGQLDYTFLGRTFATMGRYLTPGCYNDCCATAFARNINLVRFNLDSNDKDANKGENIGLLYSTNKCCDCGCCCSPLVTYEYRTQMRYKVELDGCCPACWLSGCCSGLLVINIMDLKAEGEPIVGKAVYRTGTSGKKYNENGDEDTSYLEDTTFVDDTRKNCCSEAVNPHFVIHFPEAASSIDKFNIVNQIAYIYHYSTL